MKLTSREKWLYYLTVLKTSQTGKILTMEQKQAISEFIRKKICPDIDYTEWLEMEKDMIKMKTQIVDLMYEGIQASMGEGIPKEAEKLFDQSEIAKLDDSMRDTLGGLDFNKIESVFNNLPSEQRKELSPMFEQVKKYSDQYKKEKKDDTDQNN